MDPIPVTVLTGFLGAGKTTLLNRILTEPHGRRYAVIVNEFGEIGIDNDLVIGADEEVFEMNNGCICCTVRGDLIRILGALAKRRGKFDAILVETTGLADPAPVAQTFFVDEDVAEKTRLDAIVTVADAHHLGKQLHDNREAAEQLALADLVLLNKADLVTPEALATIEARIRGMNPHARIIRTTRCDVPLDAVLDLRAFDLDRVLADTPDFLSRDGLEHDHHHDHCDDPHCGHDHGHVHDHRDGNASPVHDDAVKSVSLSADRPIDGDRFMPWFRGLLAENGGDILRSKGILDIAGETDRYVLQGVHMMMEGDFRGSWPAGPKRSRLVFIGRDLHKLDLKAGFEACLA
jgi:G3E family GTPase